jgi:hypothetical protein
MRHAFLAVILGLAGCGGNKQETDVNGHWSHRLPPPLMASGEDLDLQQNGEAISGTGQYLIEGGPGGQLTVSGVIKGSQLNLTLVRDYGLQVTYAAEVESANTMHGTLTYDDTSIAAHNAVFVRASGTVCPLYCLVGMNSCTLADGSCTFSCNQCLCESIGGKWSAGATCH